MKLLLNFKNQDVSNINIHKEDLKTKYKATEAVAGKFLLGIRKFLWLIYLFF